MPLVLDNLRNAVEALSELQAAAKNVARMEQFNEVEQKGIRAGVIQNFEVTYELCWKLMDRWLSTNLGANVVDGIQRRELFRLAAQQRLIADVDVWWQYHQARNTTSHIYDERRTEAVYSAIGDFVHDARALLTALEAHGLPFTAYKFRWIEEWRIVMFAPPRGAWDGTAESPLVIELGLSRVSARELAGDETGARETFQFLWSVNSAASMIGCVPAP